MATITISTDPDTPTLSIDGQAADLPLETAALVLVALRELLKLAGYGRGSDPAGQN